VPVGRIATFGRRGWVHVGGDMLVLAFGYATVLRSERPRPNLTAELVGDGKGDVGRDQFLLLDVDI